MESSGTTADATAELSLSVDDSNKLREKLGLRPLVVESEAEKAEAAEKRLKENKRKAEEDQKEKEAAEIAARVEKAKKHRLLNEKTEKGQGLGDLLATEDDGAAGWVERSRIKEEQRKQAAKQRKKARKLDAKAIASKAASAFDDLDENVQEVATESLRGVKVRHNATDFTEGQTEILTLEDSMIVDSEGIGEYSLNDKEDRLESLKKSEEYRHAKGIADARREVRNYDEGAGILAKYDDKDGPSEMTLDGMGKVDVAKQQKLEEIRRKLQESDSVNESKTLYKLDTPSSVVNSSSDFLTTEEVSFTKPVKQKKLRKKKKEKLDIEGLIHETEGGEQERGSRAMRGERQLKAEEEDQQVVADKNASYDRAVEAKNAKTMTNQAKLEEAKPEPESMDQDDGAWEEDAVQDDELYSVLARARRLAQAKKAVSTTEMISERIATEHSEKVEVEEERIDYSAADGGLLFSETTEFCLKLGAQQMDMELPTEILKAENEKRDQMSGLASMRPAEQMLRKPEEDEEEYVVNEEHEEKLEQVMSERSLSGGIAAALEMAKERGMLEEEMAGRSNDLRGSGYHVYQQLPEGHNYDPGMNPTGGKDLSQVGKNVKLDYYDEFGRKTTPKEAFRMMSHKFHGKKPGKKRQEKRMKQFEEEQALRVVQQSGEDKLMQVMINKQEESKAAYVVLSGPNAIKPQIDSLVLAKETQLKAASKKVKKKKT